MTTNNKGVIPEKWLKHASNQLTSRFEVLDRGDSLVRIPLSEDNEIEKRDNGPGEIRTPDPRHVKAVS